MLRPWHVLLSGVISQHSWYAQRSLKDASKEHTPFCSTPFSLNLHRADGNTPQSKHRTAEQSTETLQDRAGISLLPRTRAVHLWGCVLLLQVFTFC